MTDWHPRVPYNRQMWSTRLESDTMVPNTEERDSIRVPELTYRALATAQVKHSLPGIEQTASLGIYYSLHTIRGTYNVEWSDHEDWYLEHLLCSSERFEGGKEVIPTLTLEHEPPGDHVINIRPKERNRAFVNELQRLLGCENQWDVYRFCIYYALLMYDWQTYAGDRWTDWLDHCRKAVWEFEQILQDRQRRIDQD